MPKKSSKYAGACVFCPQCARRNSYILRVRRVRTQRARDGAPLCMCVSKARKTQLVIVILLRVWQRIEHLGDFD